MSEMVYCASPEAIRAATAAYAEDQGGDTEKLTSAFIAMHHPSLGLDRSVCLRDVVEFLRDPEHWKGYSFRRQHWTAAADFFENEFGGHS